MTSGAGATRPGFRSDTEMLGVDIPEHLRDGLRRIAYGLATAIDGDAAVAAAVAADRLDVYPGALAHLAELVRRGGREVAAALTEPFPEQRHAVLVQPWLRAAAEPATSLAPDKAFTLDEAFARWLEAVAHLVSARRRARSGSG